jgi:hypothetical protein
VEETRRSANLSRITLGSVALRWVPISDGNGSNTSSASSKVSATLVCLKLSGLDTHRVSGGGEVVLDSGAPYVVQVSAWRSGG